MLLEASSGHISMYIYLGLLVISILNILTWQYCF